MFDIDGGKLLIIGIVALVVIGPKELPGVMRQVGQAIARLRRMAAEFQGQFMDAMREAELDELRKDVTNLAKVDMNGLDPFDAMKKDVAATKADIESALEVRAVEPAPSPASVDMSGLPSGVPDENETFAAEGIAPNATEPEADLGVPLPAPTTRTKGPTRIL
jgi:sec-independent protein translocase protein TatB